MPIPIQCYESISKDWQISTSWLQIQSSTSEQRGRCHSQRYTRKFGFVTTVHCRGIIMLYMNVASLNTFQRWTGNKLVSWCTDADVLLMSLASAFWTDCRRNTRRWHTTTINSTICDWIRYKCNFSLCNAMPETWVLRPLGHFNFWLSLRSATWRWMLKSGLRPKFNLTSV